VNQPPHELVAPREVDILSRGGGSLSAVAFLIAVCLRVFRVSLLRTFVFVVLAGTALMALGLWLPVSHYFATSDYSRGDFDYEVGLVLNGTAEQRLQSISKPGSYVSFTNLDDVTLAANDRSAPRTEVYLTRLPASLEHSWFSSVITIRSRPVQGDQWLDISAGLARALDVGPGDRVTMPLGSGTYSAAVRRVLAIQHHETDNVAAGPMPSAAEVGVSALPEFQPTVATLRSRASAADIAALFTDLPKGDSVSVIPRESFAREQSQRALFGERAVLAVSLLSYLAVVALSLSESTALLRRSAVPTALLTVLGARRRPLTLAILTAEGVAVALGAAFAFFISTRVAYSGVLAADLPPGYSVPIALACLLAGTLYLGGAAACIVRHLRRNEPTLVLQGSLS